MPDSSYYDDNITVEWINDSKYVSASLHPNHGVVYGELLNSFYNYIKGKDLKLFTNRTSLSLNNPNGPVYIDDLRKTIAPDLFVVCDNKFELVGNNVVCIPDFICEVVSLKSIKLDNEIKKDLYLSKGVKEYWIASYLDKTIKVYFDDKELIFRFEDQVQVNIFNDLTICLKDMELFMV